MKRTIYLIVLSVITCICIVVGLVIHSGYGWNVDLFSLTSAGKNIHMTKTVDPYKNILLDLDTIDIHLHQGDAFEVTYTGPENRKPKIHVENNTLYVQDTHKVGFVFNIGIHSNANIDITVPKDIRLGKVQLQSDVSDFLLSDLTIQKFTSSVDTGDLTLKNTEIEEAKISSDTGDMNLDGVKLQKATLSTDTGDITINCLGDKKDFSMDLSTDVGDISVNHKEYDDNYHYDSDGNNYLNVNTDTGDIQVDFHHS